MPCHRLVQQPEGQHEGRGERDEREHVLQPAVADERGKIRRIKGDEIDGHHRRHRRAEVLGAGDHRAGNRIQQRVEEEAEYEQQQDQQRVQRREGLERQRHARDGEALRHQKGIASHGEQRADRKLRKAHKGGAACPPEYCGAWR